MFRPRFRDPSGKEAYFRGHYVYCQYKERVGDRISDGKYPEAIFNVALSPLIFPLAWILTYHPDSHLYLERIKD